jgi:hypothetical protein
MRCLKEDSDQHKEAIDAVHRQISITIFPPETNLSYELFTAKVDD